MNGILIFMVFWMSASFFLAKPLLAVSDSPQLTIPGLTLDEEAGFASLPQNKKEALPVLSLNLGPLVGKSDRTHVQRRTSEPPSFTLDFSYDADSGIYADGRWKPLEISDCMQERSAEKEGGLSELSLVTYNVWFDRYYFEKRAQALFSILKTKKAAVIGLHEVTPRFLKLLREEKWCQEHYILSDFKGDSIGAYGSLMLISKSLLTQLQAIKMHILPTKQDRQLILLDLATASGTLLIGTSHLESTHSQGEMRKSQINKVFDLIGEEHSQHAIFMGDCNFADSQSDEDQFLTENFAEWVDAGATDDPISTRLDCGYLNGDEHVQGRVDRVFFRSVENGLVLRSYELLGDKTIKIEDSLEDASRDYADIYPSDHKGIYVDFSIK